MRSSTGIELLYDSKYREICRNIATPKSLAEDLFQEVAITINQKGYDLHSINSRNELPYFFARFAKQTFMSNAFRYKYQLAFHNRIIYDQGIDLNNECREYADNTITEKKTYLVQSETQSFEEEKGAKIDAVIYEFKRKKTTEREKYLDMTLKKYIEFGESGYKLSEATGIPARTIYFALDQARVKYQYIYEAAGKSKGE